MDQRTLGLIIDDESFQHTAGALQLKRKVSMSSKDIHSATCSEEAISKISDFIDTSSHDVATKVILILDGNFTDLKGEKLGYIDIFDALTPIAGNIIWYLICNSGITQINDDMKKRAEILDAMMKKSNPNTGMVILSTEGKPNAISNGISTFMGLDAS